MAINSNITLTLQDFEDELFWKVIHVLLQAVFPTLKVFNCCDSNIPAMDTISNLSNRAKDAILMSVK